VAFLELIGPTLERVRDALDTAEAHLHRVPPGGNLHLGLSPHAPYSVHPELLAGAVALSAEHRVPLAMHLAESAEEMELLRDGGGPLRTLLERLDAWDPQQYQRGRRPLDYLRQLAQADRTLVVHGNYLDDEEIRFLANHRERMSVVYCPRTQAYFRHHPYPLEKLLAAGAAVALGTDSRASSPDLSMLEEMRAAGHRHPAVSPAAILKMATLGGVRALGLVDGSGSLEAGKPARMTAIGLPRGQAADPNVLVLDPGARVVGRWFAGARQPASE